MSTYTIALPDTDQPKTYAKKNAAIEFVNKQAATNHVSLQVVDANTGTVIHVGNPALGRKFKPFERLESPKTTAPHYEGFVPAYHRKRIDATVYRGLDEYGNKGTWRIFDGRSGNFVEVANTKAANEVTKRMKTEQL